MHKKITINNFVRKLIQKVRVYHVNNNKIYLGGFFKGDNNVFCNNACLLPAQPLKSW